MSDLARLANSATEFAAANALTIVPAVPHHDFGPEVVIKPNTLDLPGFLALAAKLGGGALYLQTFPFDPGEDDTSDDTSDNPSGDDTSEEDTSEDDTSEDDTSDDDEPLPADLLKHKGQVCRVSVAFAANGLVHFWESEAAWYQQWMAHQFTTRISAQRERDEPELPSDEERLSDEERARLTGELAEKILADPAFRALKTRGERLRYATSIIPADTHRWVSWDATSAACDRWEELAAVQYADLEKRYDELVAALLADPDYQRASSPAGRKQVIGQFLIARADGFGAPARVRDELYARARSIAKTTTRGQATLL